MRWPALLFAVLVFGGCSATAFFYNRLDALLLRQVDGFVDLDRDQRRQLEPGLEAFLAWHRREELPRYVAALARLEDALAATPDDRDMLAFAQEGEEALRRLRVRSLEWVIPLTAALREEQLSRVRERLAERQLELEREYLERADAEFREESREGWEETLEDYLGKLNAAQEDALDSLVASLERTDRYWMQERRRWLAVFDDALARGPGWRDTLRGLFARDLIDSPAYQAIYERNQARAIGALRSILEARTERQRDRLQAKLAGLREELSALAADA